MCKLSICNNKFWFYFRMNQVSVIFTYFYLSTSASLSFGIAPYKQRFVIPTRPDKQRFDPDPTRQTAFRDPDQTKSVYHVLAVLLTKKIKFIV